MRIVSGTALAASAVPLTYRDPKISPGQRTRYLRDLSHSETPVEPCNIAAALG